MTARPASPVHDRASRRHLTTPGGTGCTASADASSSTMQQWPDATCTGFDATQRKPNIPAELVGREEIRAGGERLQAQWDFFVQTRHPGTIQPAGNTPAAEAAFGLTPEATVTVPQTGQRRSSTTCALRPATPRPAQEAP
jgi:hypothetical protein